jgi:hypothetical protein
MRNITKVVVVTGYGNTPDEIISFSNKIGFEYPAPHFLITITQDGTPHATKMRPLGKRCALIRDSKIADEGIGIIVGGNTPKIDASVSNMISIIIKSIVEDLCIENISFISDEINTKNRVDISEINIGVIPDAFRKLR